MKLTNVATGIQYEPFASLKQATLGNTLTMANSWGNDGRLASRRLYVTNTGATRSLLSYAYDNDDNITGITDGVTPANTLTLGYDARGRLAQTLWQSGSFAREDILHDANGNRTAVERRIGANDNTPAQTDSYTRTAGTNRLASITGTFGVRSIVYDARGNTQSESRSGGIAVTTAYDGHGRLISYARTGDASQTNGYNGMDERVVVTSGTVIRRFVYDPDGRVIGEYGTSATNVIAERIWMTPETNDAGMFGGDDGTGGYAPIAVVIGTTLRWVHANHMGVPQLHTSNTGAIIATPAYTLPGFPGQFRTYADLYYNKYRDYDTTTGRYIQADPIGLAGGQSPYSYAMGNPLRYTDPTGLECLNLFPYDEGNYRAAAAKHCRDFDRPGDLHIMSHGSPNKICPFSRTECMTPERFVDVYGPQLAGAKSIFLKSCYGGRRMSRSPAQFLSNATGVPVTAYPDLTWWRPNDGFTGSGPRERTWKEWFQDWGGLREAHPYKYQGVPKHHGPRDTSQPREPITFQPGH